MTENQCFMWELKNSIVSTCDLHTEIQKKKIVLKIENKSLEKIFGRFTSQFDITSYAKILI